MIIKKFIRLLHRRKLLGLAETTLASAGELTKGYGLTCVNSLVAAAPDTKVKARTHTIAARFILMSAKKLCIVIVRLVDPSR